MTTAPSIKRPALTPSDVWERHRHVGDAPASADFDNPLEAYFWRTKDLTLHKWLHYFKIYHRHFQEFRGKPVRMLEIGVWRGGSLGMWRDYFGPEATIFGLDINPQCARFDGVHGQVRIGSQDDPDFLNAVIDEMGGVDIVLDDGSHDSRHISATLDVLFPRLSDGGVYMVEDLHCAYWERFSGGYRRNGSFLQRVKRMVDDMHHWYHNRGQECAATRDALSGLHIYDSIVVLEKDSVAQPVHAERGGGVSRAAEKMLTQTTRAVKRALKT